MSAQIDSTAPVCNTDPGPGVFFRKSISADIDEHAAKMSGWRLTYNQVSAGAFRGELVELDLGWMQVFHDRTNQVIIKQGDARPGTISFSIPVSCNGNVYCAGSQVPEGMALVTKADSLPQLRAPQAVEIVVVSVEQSVLERELELHGIPFSLLDSPQIYRLQELAVRHNLQALCNDLAREEFQTHELLSQDAGRHQIRDVVMSQLLDLLPCDQVVSLATSVRKRIVDRACEYAMTHLDEPFTILDMCRHIGASRRKLQYCFQETLEINPVAYLRALRLNAARRELRERSVSCVQDVATRWGFWHLSRFSSEYRELFGELPSQTLNR
ncbi:DNA-binding domain-containing protein, AraC-type [Pseudomonas cichorii]|uniref:DNA-binding domain-containing protein, AraC-type n=1 Tax=Pseudomonas cichorii TaxID=36746 RepID=A0A3M4M8G3_PSECI|nr:helix-turn-helix domain-containing protein [Pseudomonas cichorii]RMQ49451.1 DNA-binding domain-containing protein, AraC-type [Pseudomonas cichorii]